MYINNDTISISALREGVPIFYDAEALESLREKTGIKKETPRKVFWLEDRHNNYSLVGKVE